MSNWRRLDPGGYANLQTADPPIVETTSDCVELASTVGHARANNTLFAEIDALSAIQSIAQRVRPWQRVM